MTLKEGVTQQGVKPAIFYAIGIAEMVYRYESLSLVVTSLTDSHDDKPGSLHPKGLAVDLRTRGIFHGTVVSIFKQLKNILDPLGFDVVMEADHLHLEWDPKAGENWQRFDRPAPQKKDDFVA